jgi:hypothetical protein
MPARQMSIHVASSLSCTPRTRTDYVPNLASPLPLINRQPFSRHAVRDASKLVKPRSW